MNATDLCHTPATELGRLIRARQVSPLEITEAVLVRIDRLNPQLQIGGRRHWETDIFRAAACFEALQPWATQRPPLA